MTKYGFYATIYKITIPDLYLTFEAGCRDPVLSNQKGNKMMTEKITSNQRKQIVRFVEDGIDAMNLQKDGAQRLIENGGEFQTELKKLVERFSITNQYADEEVKSSYGYLSGYKPKGTSQQSSARPS